MNAFASARVIGTTIKGILEPSKPSVSRISRTTPLLSKPHVEVWAVGTGTSFLPVLRYFLRTSSYYVSGETELDKGEESFYRFVREVFRSEAELVCSY